jgi:hypothetical protein
MAIGTVNGRLRRGVTWLHAGNDEIAKRCQSSALGHPAKNVLGLVCRRAR